MHLVALFFFILCIFFLTLSSGMAMGPLLLVLVLALARLCPANRWLCHVFRRKESDGRQYSHLMPITHSTEPNPIFPDHGAWNQSIRHHLSVEPTTTYHA